MRHCTTLALLLSLSACEHASQATEPSTPSPTPTPSPSPTPTPPPSPTPSPMPAISAQPKKALPAVPCRARVCPEWKSEPQITRPEPPVAEEVQPLEDRQYPTSRAGTPWKGAKSKVRIQKRPEAGK